MTNNNIFLNLKMKFSQLTPYTTYFLLNMITYLMIRDTSDVANSNPSFYYMFNFILPLLCLSSFLLLIRTKQDAGEIDINTKGILERDITLSDSSIRLKYTPLMIMKLMPCNGCKHCKIMELPLRSFHCPTCQRCIRTYDHHSKLIGNCIGENNHFVYILFLFSQSVTFTLAIIGLIKRYFIQQYFVKVLIIIYISIISLVVSALVFAFILHLYLLFTNQTSYELFYKENCPYLRIFKQERMKIYTERGIEIKDELSYRPFDSGIKKNLGYAFFKLFNTYDKMKWEDIYFANLRTNHVSFSYCKNKYLPSV